MIHWLIYLHFQHNLSWHIFLVVSNIVLQLLLSVFFMAIFLFSSSHSWWSGLLLYKWIRKKVMNGYKGLLKYIRFFQQRKISVIYRSKENPEIVFHVIKVIFKNKKLFKKITLFNSKCFCINFIYNFCLISSIVLYTHYNYNKNFIK